MRIIKIGLACAVVLAAVAHPALAGKIILSGDSNIGNPIDGSSGASVVAGNSTFFTNILGSGSTVLIQEEHDQSSVDNSASAIHSLYNGIGGVTSTLETSGSAITSGSLAGVDLFISIMPSNNYSASEISALSGFLAGPGVVLFMGDHNGLDDENNRINAALSALGASMALGTSVLDSGFNTTSNIDSDPLTSGITAFSYAATNTIISGGNSLIRTASSNATFIAYENTEVPEPGSILAMLSLAGCGVGAVVVRRRRAKKLAA